MIRELCQEELEIWTVLEDLENFIDWTASFMLPDESESADISIAKLKAFIHLLPEEQVKNALRCDMYDDLVLSILEKTWTTEADAENVDGTSQF